MTHKLRIKILSCLKLHRFAEVKQKAVLTCCFLLGSQEWQELA